MNFFPRFINRSLSLKQVFVALAFSMILGIVFAAAQIYFDFLQVRQNTDERFKQILQSVEHSAAQATFVLDDVLAQRVVDGLFEYKAVVRVIILDNVHGFLAQSEKKNSTGPFLAVSRFLFGDQLTYNLSLRHNDSPVQIGELRLDVDTNIIATSFFQRSGTLILLGFMRNLILASILIAVFHFMVARPLSIFRKSIRLKQKEIDIPPSHEEDDLGQLVQEYNRLNEEREELENQLRRSQKLEAVGQLTSGIAHDFNNILAIVMGNLELIENRVRENADLSHFAKTALAGGQRGADLTRKLLQFSRLDDESASLASVNEFVLGMEPLLAKSLTVSIRIEIHTDKHVWPVKINTGDLEDALLNMAINARDAMPNGGLLIFETSNKILDDDYVKRNPTARTGEFVMLSISDTGQGMPAEIREKVLDPFFTTKGVGKGTGLGLSMVYGFVKRSGGHLKIYSEIGKGTTIRLYLPRSTEGAEPEKETLQEIELPSGDEHILVVDDEPVLAALAKTNLESLGYQVETANNAHQALNFLQDGRKIDLLFSDIIMPKGMDGYALALKSHKINPELKILLTSGFTKNREEYTNGDGKFMASLVSRLLSKPYNQIELAVAIRQTLDG